MTKEQLAYLERRLTDERSRISEILRRFQADAEQDEARDQTGDLSGVPTHPADLGTDQQQREVDDAVARRERRATPSGGCRGGSRLSALGCGQWAVGCGFSRLSS